MDLDNEPTADPAAWDILIAFANGTINSLPEAEKRLTAHLGDRFSFAQWKAAFDEILKAEDDESAAVAAIEVLKEKAVTHHTSAPVPPSTRRSRRPSLPELERAEAELMQAVNSLHERKRIRGTRPTLEDLLNPVEETEVGDSPYRFPGGDADIIAEVKRGEMQTEDLEEDSECGDEGDESKEPEITPQQGMELCLSVERLCLQYSDVDGLAIHPLQSQLRRLRSHLRKVDFESCTQVTLDRFFIPRQDG
ncbi:hypothetical protein PAXINDRAFT_18069 [Paxillus involutus ATCC 200175]|uniref:Uncharacterized protein n=1 Tax=Paxillus involutus ATCC 200175 TaxID=664439 RepID=A0A0C9TNK6_PAXIN|nr:hypothetical protein PAXINDRAFT_18069 [Paxillus involutus ATCC 200175]